MTKKCFKCGEVKPISEFYKCSSMSDKYSGKCKECAKKDTKENYRAKRQHYAAYERERWQRPERKKVTTEYQRNTRKRNKLRYKANSAVSNAVRDGRLIKQPCEKCGSVLSQAHHPDYTKPLDVVWLCRSHHLELHGKESYCNLPEYPNPSISDTKV